MDVLQFPFVVEVNGKPIDFFKSSGGLLQGCPLSLFIFIIKIKTLRWEISLAINEGFNKDINISTKIPYFTHSQCVDDALLVGAIHIHEAKSYKKILEVFGWDFGQEIIKKN
jgi:hypothetical protein